MAHRHRWIVIDVNKNDYELLLRCKDCKAIEIKKW